MGNLSSHLKVYDEHHKRLSWLRGTSDMLWPEAATMADGAALSLNDITLRLHDLSINPTVKLLRAFANLIGSDDKEFICGDGQQFFAFTFPIGWHSADTILCVSNGRETSNLVTGEYKEIVCGDGTILEVYTEPEPEPVPENYTKGVLDEFYGGVPDYNWRKLLN